MIPEIVYSIHHQFFFCTSAVFLDRKMFAFFESFFFCCCCYKQANKLEPIYCSIWPTTDLPVCSEHVHFFAVQELAFPEVHLNGAMTAELFALQLLGQERTQGYVAVLTIYSSLHFSHAPQIQNMYRKILHFCAED